MNELESDLRVVSSTMVVFASLYMTHTHQLNYLFMFLKCVSKVFECTFRFYVILCCFAPMNL